jgi:hypothetical protein
MRKPTFESELWAFSVLLPVSSFLDKYSQKGIGRFSSQTKAQMTEILRKLNSSEASDIQQISLDTCC